MPYYLSPLVVPGNQRNIGFATVAQAAQTIYTTANTVEEDGSLYLVEVYARTRTIDGGTTPTMSVQILATDSGSVRTYTVPFVTEAGAIATAYNIGALGSTYAVMVIRADKNTNIQVARTSGGTPSNNGVLDLLVYMEKLS